MAIFVLVHGAWGGSYGFRTVRRPLLAAGHDVYSPSLTGLGERVHLSSPQVDLTTHVTDVVNAVTYEDLRDIVLLGYSYGGMVVTGVADKIAKRVSALVYLDAFLPESGQSLFDINIPANTQRFVANAGNYGGAAVPSPLTGAHKSVPRHVYVHGTVLPRESPFKPFYDRVKNDPAWSAHALACGHHVMLDLPEKTAEIMEEAAA